MGSQSQRVYSRLSVWLQNNGHLPIGPVPVKTQLLVATLRRHYGQEWHVAEKAWKSHPEMLRHFCNSRGIDTISDRCPTALSPAARAKAMALAGQPAVRLNKPHCKSKTHSKVKIVRRQAAAPTVVLVAGMNPNSDEFLRSYEWRTLRIKALNLYGARCQCCGHTAATSGEPINVDHIKPRRLYPELALTLDNLQILCGPCNQGKGNWDMTDWRVAHVSA